MQKTKRLKPEKWKAAFDADGRPIGFRKLLKAIRKGVSSFSRNDLCNEFDFVIKAWSNIIKSVRHASITAEE